MSRDQHIEDVFLSADDAIQGLWGLHSYINAAVNTADRQDMKARLPAGFFQITHEWARRYDRDELLAKMDNVFEFVHCRNSLVLLVSLFEGTIKRFNERLAKSSHASRFKSYKQLLVWGFALVQNSPSGSASMRQRLPSNCGDVDNARRLRNCFAHNNGRYEHSYLTDAIDDGWTQVRYPKEIGSVSSGEKIFIVNDKLEELLRSHVELLHMLHNTIQRAYFGETEDYNYAKEGKAIEWHRILSGQTFVGM